MKKTILMLICFVTGVQGKTIFEIRKQNLSTKNYAGDIRELEAMAANDNSDAITLLGEVYYFGLGVAPNHKKAFASFKKAAILKNGLAANHLARMYVNGEGVPSNIDEAIKFYDLAISYGYPDAEVNKAQWIMFKKIQNGYSQDVIKLLEQRSDADAFNLLGKIYHFGYGVPVNFTKAKDYYEKAFELKSPTAANHLGRMYSNGEGVKKDEKKAKEFYDAEQKYKG